MVKFKHFLKRPDGNKHTVSKVSSLFVAVLQVWFWGTPTVWPRCVLSPATRFWGSSSQRVWPRTCPRISTTLSRRLWQSGSIWRETERYSQRVTASAPKCHQFEFQQKSALFEMWLLFQDVCRSILKSYSLKAQTWDTNTTVHIQKWLHTHNMLFLCLQDKDAKFRLILIESRIHRLARYYKTKRVLAPNWK